MTRVAVYSSALVAFVAATAMTLASIIIPNWIGWQVESPSGKFTKTLGLHRSCSSLDTTCRSFPQEEDCHVDTTYFCSMWRSVSFMMSAAALFELVTLVAFFILITGGKQKRESGWRVMSFLLVLVGILQCASMAIVAYLFDNDDRFFVGWKLSESWILCTVSWSVCMLSAAGICVSAYFLAPEGGYEIIPSERHEG
ncbi:hypothetical protein OIDMADRAFT_17303 [Oidiodendron maius Zn]|uniref:Uncharacterized protein n=1 Tax=Oidiodendron maius (strain Zn) TaxID=913774 RepID=A0A0C3DWC4_OIDMZ|nr:hypothetical protein OIDMADRAFT_17303 [Oidiodendron maius Zn]